MSSSWSPDDLRILDAAYEQRIPFPGDRASARESGAESNKKGG